MHTYVHTIYIHTQNACIDSTPFAFTDTIQVSKDTPGNQELPAGNLRWYLCSAHWRESKSQKWWIHLHWTRTVPLPVHPPQYESTPGGPGNPGGPGDTKRKIWRRGGGEEGSKEGAEEDLSTKEVFWNISQPALWAAAPMISTAMVSRWIILSCETTKRDTIKSTTLESVDWVLQRWWMDVCLCLFRSVLNCQTWLLTWAFWWCETQRNILVCVEMLKRLVNDTGPHYVHIHVQHKWYTSTYATFGFLASDICYLFKKFPEWFLKEVLVNTHAYGCNFNT